jgi:hypothetical protein
VLRSRADAGGDLSGAGIYTASIEDAEGLAAVQPADVGGKVIVAQVPSPEKADPSRRRAILRSLSRFDEAMRRLKPPLAVLLDPADVFGRRLDRARLIDPENRPPVWIPLIQVRGPEAVKPCESDGGAAVRASVAARWDGATERPVRLRNVIGLVRGSDPHLKDTYVLVTAHYDHLGRQLSGAGDTIFNGANDDASGTASVIEIASALAALPAKPRRTLVFITFFGEELGLLGSRFYARHPVFPLDRTVAAINLEHLGRTDAEEGAKPRNLEVTGFDYTSLGGVLAEAGKETGVHVNEAGPASNSYFSRSDNYSFAEKGVPAHTVAAVYEFPDYHKVGDHWEKLDYANMARLGRTIGLAALMVAQSGSDPQWSESAPEKFRAARTAAKSQ